MLSGFSRWPQFSLWPLPTPAKGKLSNHTYEKAEKCISQDEFANYLFKISFGHEATTSVKNVIFTDKEADNSVKILKVRDMKHDTTP